MEAQESGAGRIRRHGVLRIGIGLTTGRSERVVVVDSWAEGIQMELGMPCPPTGEESYHLILVDS